MLFRLNNGTALDPADVDVFYVLKDNVDLNEEVERRVRALEIDFAGTIAIESHESGLAKLIRFRDSLEQCLREILNRWSIPYALTLFRSIVAISSVETFDSPEEFARNLRLMELAIARHCRYDTADVIFDEDGVWNIHVTHDDVEALLVASSTAQLLGVCQVNLRRLAHGGTLVGVDSSWTVEFQSPLEELAKSYGDRLAQYGNAFRHSGTPGTSQLPYGRGEEWILLGGKNDGRWIWSGLLQRHLEVEAFSDAALVSDTDSYVPALILHPFSLDMCIELLRIVPRAFEEQGFTIDAALALLKADALIGEELYCTFRPGHRLRTLGFFVLSRTELVRRACAIPSSSGQEAQSPAVDNALRFIQRDADEAPTISFNEHSGTRHYVGLGEALNSDRRYDQFQRGTPPFRNRRGSERRQRECARGVL